VFVPEELTQKVGVKIVDQEFERRVAEAQRAVRRNTTVALNQAQFDALCSVTYNRGAKGTRPTYDYINRDDFAGAASNISNMMKSLMAARRNTSLPPGC
jgi:lysozyme